MNQNIVWGPHHLFTATPKWANALASICLSLFAVYSGFVLQFPNAIPAGIAGGIALVIGLLTLVFKWFGIKAAPNTALVAEAGQVTSGISEEQVNRIVGEIKGLSGGVTPDQLKAMLHDMLTAIPVTISQVPAIAADPASDGTGNNSPPADGMQPAKTTIF